MNEINIRRIRSNLFEFQCFDASTAAGIASSAKYSRQWDVATISLPNGEQVVAPDVRSAYVLKRAKSLEVYALFESTLNERLQFLNKTLFTTPLIPTEPQVLRYSIGGEYKNHRDGPFNGRRRVTIIIYLNGDFDGGETVFPTLKHSVRPAPGKAIVFDSTELHRAQPVFAGEKLVIIIWMLRKETSG